jgi:hypothetical protein
MLLGVPQTVAMRGQEFQKFCKRLVGMVCINSPSDLHAILSIYRWMLQRLALGLRPHLWLVAKLLTRMVLLAMFIQHQELPVYVFFSFRLNKTAHSLLVLVNTLQG